ncbi:MAG: (di)nucleoside polyphosphate hydrolase [Candidatus Peribacteria bacterium]|nr:(di)nucleoside polyphosphate hydrolase [Candidatus Peribacteria bacterium]
MIRHFTATAIVIDSRKRVLLLWHKRLGRWMPPGGHVDANELPEDAARRECKEETGLDIELASDHQPNVFETSDHEGRLLRKPYLLLLEHIPASPERGEPFHQHMDFVYLARPLCEEQALQCEQTEAEDLRWFTWNDISEMDENTEIFANVKKTLKIVLT